jgi:hypothetical protein
LLYRDIAGKWILTSIRPDQEEEMISVGAYKAKTHLPKLIERVSKLRSAAKFFDVEILSV